MSKQSEIKEAKKIQADLSAKYALAADAPCVCCGKPGYCVMGDYVGHGPKWSKEDSKAFSEAHNVISGAFNLFA